VLALDEATPPPAVLPAEAVRPPAPTLLPPAPLLLVAVLRPPVNVLPPIVLLPPGLGVPPMDEAELPPTTDVPEKEVGFVLTPPLAAELVVLDAPPGAWLDVDLAPAPPPVPGVLVPPLLRKPEPLLHAARAKTAFRDIASKRLVRMASPCLTGPAYSRPAHRKWPAQRGL
jgi:hypothetical protein